ncbi:hypothetical protein BY996DRAFT_6444686 [Phakopsora pachyrhizi]|nr:hypothetical protein BY996DRAFT_6444686 [Phakopsora pachyrhizi]
MKGHNSDRHWQRYKPERAFTITGGRTVISNKKNEVFAIVEYRRFSDMTLEERNDWNQLSFERSSESRAFVQVFKDWLGLDGVAPEEDTVTDDRNKRERSRVRRWIEADDSQMRERMM